VATCAVLPDTNDDNSESPVNMSELRGAAFIGEAQGKDRCGSEEVKTIATMRTNSGSVETQDGAFDTIWESHVTSGGSWEEEDHWARLTTYYSASDNTVTESFETFMAERNDERKVLFYSVLRLGFLSMAVGSAIFAAGSFFLAPILPCGILLVVTGIVIISTCPVEHLDVDHFSEEYPYSSLALCLSFAVLHLVFTIRYSPHANVFSALLFIEAGFGFRKYWLCSKGFPWLSGTSFTTVTSLAVSLGNLGEACSDLLLYTDPYTEHPDQRGCAPPSLFFLARGCCQLLLVTALVMVLCCLLFGLCRRGTSSTIILYCMIYASLVITGIRNLCLGMAYSLSSSCLDLCAFYFIVGVTWILPNMLLLIMGRRQLFGCMARYFDRNRGRAQRDAAFIAELLCTIPVEIGQRWWLPRDIVETRFPPEDPRRSWELGIVVSVETDKFAVRIPSTPTVSAAEYWVPVADRGASASELLSKAKQGLRCIEWSKMTRSLLQSSRGSSVKEDIGNNWMELSRPVARRETIDFFISHSWHDDAEAKFDKLEEVAESFFHRHGRYPTFWFDRVCIDQSCISDGLKLLPVNVTACSRVLVLFGHTYASRLWCAWELFVLFSFAQQEHAAERAILLPLSDDVVVRSLLDEFDARKAHCFNPNEEARLRQVIEVVGVEEFNRRVHAWAARFNFSA